MSVAARVQRLRDSDAVNDAVGLGRADPSSLSLDDDSANVSRADDRRADAVLGVRVASASSANLVGVATEDCLEMERSIASALRKLSSARGVLAPDAGTPNDRTLAGRVPGFARRHRRRGRVRVGSPRRGDARASPLSAAARAASSAGRAVIASRDEPSICHCWKTPRSTPAAAVDGVDDVLGRVGDGAERRADVALERFQYQSRNHDVRSRLT